MSALEALREFTDGLKRGPVDDPRGLISVLEPVWDHINVDDPSMESRKLHRIESPMWNPPLLSFQVERHGAMVAGGSTRAEMQKWEVNLETGEARLSQKIGRRQKVPMSPRLEVKALAQEIAKVVEEGSDDDRLKWADDRGEVKIILSRVVPNVGFRQTVEGRRKRFKLALFDAMRDIAWTEVSEVGGSVFRRLGARTDRSGSDP